MFSYDYILQREQEIHRYIAEGFTKVQIEEGIKVISCAFACIIVKHESVPPKEFEGCATSVANRIYNDGLDINDGKSFHYRTLREILNKEKEKVIEAVFEYREHLDQPEDDKIERYVEVLATIARDFIELSLKEYRELGTTKLAEQEAQRLSRRPLKEVNEQWREYYNASTEQSTAAERVRWNANLANVEEIPRDNKGKKVHRRSKLPGKA